MVSPTLDKDTFTVILGHIHAVELIHKVIRSCPRSSLYRPLAIKRRLELPVLLTVGSPRYTTRLYNLLLSLPDLASSLKVLEIAGGPSINQDWGDHGLSEKQKSELKDLHSGVPFNIVWDPEEDSMRRQATCRVVAGRKLVAGLPALLELTHSLEKIQWRRCPGPHIPVLDALVNLTRFTKLSVDCASGKWIGRNMDEEDEYWDVLPFFSTIGPQIHEVTFLHVNQATYKSIAKHIHLLESLKSFHFDITCGDWDSDGRGSPQVGASQNYRFPPLAFHPDAPARKAALVTTDLALIGVTAGPLRLFEGSRITRFSLNIKNCLSWVTLRGIRAFSGDGMAASFPNLSHLVISEAQRYAKCTEAEYTIDQLRHVHYYVGIHRFLENLPNLKKLWVNAFVLGALKTADDPDSWRGNAETLPRSETWATEEWASILPTLHRLTSLRVGLGLLDADSLEHVLDACDPGSLTEIGFEWNWGGDGTNRIPSSIMSKLSDFPKLRDIHILYPTPVPSDQLRSDGYDHRLCADTLRTINDILTACPTVSRVGMGLNCVWERSSVGSRLMDLHEVLESFDGFYGIGWEPVVGKPNRDNTAEGNDVRVNEEVGRDLIWMLEDELGVARSQAEGVLRPGA